MNAMAPLSFKTYVGFGSLLIWVIMLQSYFSFSDGCLQDERSYLLDLKEGFNLSSGRLSSWRGLNCCDWEGVACDYHTSRVITLDLSNLLSNQDDYLIKDKYDYWYKHQFSGELRPSLFNLQHLQHLDLSGNSFKGISIPPELLKLQRLTFLKLSRAGFCGEVPVELGNMSSLRHLDLSHNSWYFKTSDNQWQRNELSSNKFDVWVRNLRSLEFVEMDEVNLSKSSEQWGEALNSLPKLTQIHLSQCGLSGNIPDLSNLTRLSHLHIGLNSIRHGSLPSWFENVSSIVSLDLAMCGLNGFIPSNFMPRSRLSSLTLTANFDLKGNISFILSHSSSLVMLSLRACNLTGVFPHFVANFSKLKIMELGLNKLEGSIPSSLVSFPSLEALELSHNHLTGQIPPSLCQLSALSEVFLGHNQLSGTIPHCISNMSGLKVLSLPSNGLSGNISLQLFENITLLEELDLSENQFHINISTNWVPQFGNMASLELRSCNIGGNIPAFLSQQYQLEDLDLSNNSIVGNLPTWLWDLPSLSWLNVSNNNLEGSLPRKISHKFEIIDLHGNRLHGSLHPLDFVTFMLDLSNNEFDGFLPATIGTIKILSLSGNNLTGDIPSSICIHSYSLAILDLSMNKLSGMIPSNIGHCSNLGILKMAQNVLQGEIPKELGNLQNLRTLNVNGNNLQGIIPASFANCTSLQIFDVGNNNFEGSIPPWIEKLTDLRILSLASNKFNGTIPPQLFRLKNLQILDLPDNQLSGNIPPDVSKLNALINNSQSFHLQYVVYLKVLWGGDTDFGFNFADEIMIWIKGRATPYLKIIGEQKFMDLSRNNLSGNIPPELGFLKGLISVNISKNNLSGVIPESLGAMAYLESLDLSENKLSGNIPIQLLNLTFLAVLNLSSNMLSGLIPQGKQFSTFEDSSFLGNPNLHGPPLENKTQSLGFGRKDNYKELNNSTAKGADVDVEDPWWAVELGLSYGVGFATVIAILCFHVEWRYICFAAMDNLIYYLFE